jgi:alkylated DNA nucleotide flippase Atl1
MQNEPPAHLRLASEKDVDSRYRSVRIPGGDVLTVTEIDEVAGTVVGTRTVGGTIRNCRFTGPLRAWEMIIAGWGDQ